jgi:riboflavin kinase/FMN adenylyltransferase
MARAARLDGAPPPRYPDGMHVVRGRETLRAGLGRGPRAPSLAIGNFDGVHRGHQALLAAAVASARAAGGEAGVLTFDPHPARFFAPALAPPMLLPLGRRLELFEEAGVDFVVVEPFDAALAALEAERFADEVLAGAIGVRHVVVGYDFSFGRGRRGDGVLLARLGERLGFGVTIVPQVTVDGLVCSSTKIREFLLEGRVEGARLLLGRPYEITGAVVRGAGRGRGLGVPTANLDPEGELFLKAGIYAGRARLLDRPGRAPLAAISVGTNPTFAPAAGAPGEPPPALAVEAHLLDFAGDLYGSRVRLELWARLRDERRFPDAGALVAEIARDIERTRRAMDAMLSAPGDPSASP